MFHQFVLDGNQLINRHLYDVAHRNQVVAPIGIGDEILHIANCIVGAFLTDGRIETSLAQLGLTRTGHAVTGIMLQGPDHLRHHVVSPLQARRTDEGEIIGGGVVFRVFMILAPTEGADWEVGTSRSILPLVGGPLHEGIVDVIRIMEMEDVSQHTVGKRILIFRGYHRIGTVVAHTTQYEARLDMLLHLREMTTVHPQSHPE